jgi:hypothetical protein
MGFWGRKAFNAGIKTQNKKMRRLRLDKFVILVKRVSD